MQTLKTLEISKENFEKFGQLVSLPDVRPTSQDQTYRFWSDIARFRIEEETEIGICTVYKQTETVISGVERHLETPEILIPVDTPFALPVLREGDGPEAAACFRVKIGQAVVIDPAVWHGACLPVSAAQASYFVIFKRKTPGKDVEKKNIEPLKIII